MPGPQRVPRSTIRFDPLQHVVLEPYKIPAAVRIKAKGKAPPRPQNAWILYRAWALGELLKKNPELKGTPQAQLSKVLGAQWAKESPEVRSRFEHEANISKERHAQEFPNYVFKPQKKEDKEREREKQKQIKAREREAVKVKKEVENAMRIPSMMGISSDASAQGNPYNLLHNFTVINCSDLGPSPPISQLPTPVMPLAPLGDEAPDSDQHDASGSTNSGLSPPDGCISGGSASIRCMSQTPSHSGASDIQQQAASHPPSSATPLSTDDSMVVDASHDPKDSSSSLASPAGWLQTSKHNMDALSVFLNQAFPPGIPGPVSNRFEMPSGNIIVSPGFVEGGTSSSNYEANGLISIPLGEMGGMLDDQYDCDLSNPHAEPGPSNEHESMPFQGKEALFMQPFVQLDVSLDQLLAVGNQVGDALLDEQEACVNGERVMAAEHVQSGAPASGLKNPGAACFLPSPPESSSIVSPLSQNDFDLTGSTNICATGSSQHPFGVLGFSDSMSVEGSAPSWDAPSFGEYGIHTGIGFEQGQGGLNFTAQPGVGCGSSFSSGSFPSLPPTPVSAGPWIDGRFDIGEVSMADFSTSNFASATDGMQTQKDNSWFTSCFNGTETS